MGDMLIPELQRGNTSVTICARVSRLWDFCDPQDEAKLLHCDMVLLDEEGNGIHAAIFPPVIQKFKPLIKEGVVYNITYFRVRASNNLYKPVFNENMITFTNWTKLEEVVEVPPAFPMLTYSLTPMDQLHLCVDHREYYTDGLCLSGGSPCKWYINPDVPEAGALMARYKLLLTAGDETGDTDFILFGRMAQRIIKKPCDMLIANNPIGFIPDPITDLLEKTYIWNVSFSDHTINTGNICFQVNAVVAEINTAKDSIQASSSGTKQSETVLLQGAPSGIEDTPTKGSNLVMSSTLLTPQSSATSVQDKTIGIGSGAVVPGATPAITKEPTTTPRKRTRSSPAKTVTKRLFTDVDGGNTGSKDVADSDAAPRSSPSSNQHVIDRFVVQLKAFDRFENTSDAQSAATLIIDSRPSKGLHRVKDCTICGISLIDIGRNLMAKQDMSELGFRTMDEAATSYHSGQNGEGAPGLAATGGTKSKADEWEKAKLGRLWTSVFASSKGYHVNVDYLFVLTLTAGLEGYHVNVDGQHVTSFPYRTGFVLEDSTGLSLNEDLDVQSVFAGTLPTTHPSFSPQKHLELLPSWQAHPLPDEPVEIFIGILSAGNHFAERMSAAQKSSNVVARFFVAL
ncbi:hypothetical protein ACJX0J_031650, partial [Zea mays]